MAARYGVTRMDDQPADPTDPVADDAGPDPTPVDPIAHDPGPDVWANTTAVAANPLGVAVLPEPDDAGAPAPGAGAAPGGVAADASSPPAKRGETSQKAPWRAVREWLTVLVVALGAAVIIRVFVFQQYYIDGPSMEHTLEPHDRVLVNKLSYRLHDVNRGDVVVFDRARQSDGQTVEHDDLIKRVIALPGETITIQNCDVFIDGQQLAEPYLSTEIQSQPDPGSRCRIPYLAPQTIPDGEVFVMGDNRPQSFDSREFGPIDVDLIRGRAFVVIWPFSSWKWL